MPLFRFALLLFLLHGGAAFLVYLLLPKRALPEAVWLYALAPLALLPFRAGLLALRERENPQRRPLALGLFGAAFFYLAVLAALVQALGGSGIWALLAGVGLFLLGALWAQKGP
ncbi:hypothetical protein [Thermus filiformis]|uniref:Uncharacterized protein n=1 Tax=Thermus filiformis TaxID=276 RepID=A0A0D6X8Y7_THEFI|nr:hypothetical protein [Thermus filiformis]KIX84374.1 hypothetical protein THFILI_09905 [Thermus filiformis]